MASRRVSIAYASRWRRVLARTDMSFAFRISVHASSGSAQRQRSLPIEAPTHCDAGCQSVSTGGADRERSSSAAPCRTEHLKVTTSRPIDVLQAAIEGAFQRSRHACGLHRHRSRLEPLFASGANRPLLATPIITLLARRKIAIATLPAVAPCGQVPRASLRKENEILRQEREILKKAVAVFAKEGSR